jgi:putative FmdB family regulatory protein
MVGFPTLSLRSIMPIYAYKCESCGHAKDVLQKIADAPLTECPACGQSSFAKQLTAAGFQLKGSGWYATDFRGGSGSSASASAADPSSAESKPAESAGGTSASADGGTAGSCGASCACH